MGGTSSIPDKRIEELCEGIQSASQKKEMKLAEPEITALVDAVLAIRDDPSPFTGRRSPIRYVQEVPFWRYVRRRMGLPLLGGCFTSRSILALGMWLVEQLHILAQPQEGTRLYQTRSEPLFKVVRASPLNVAPTVFEL